MQSETKKKKEKNEKKEIKLPDLKPAKDAKGGVPPDPCGPGRHGSLRVPMDQ